MVSNLPKVWLILLLGEKPEADRNPPILYHNSRARSTGACNCGRKQAPREDPFDIKAANYDFYQVTVLTNLPGLLVLQAVFLFHLQSVFWSDHKFPLNLINLFFGEDISGSRSGLTRVGSSSFHLCTHVGAPVYVPVYTLSVLVHVNFKYTGLWAMFQLLLWFSRGANLLNLNCSCSVLWLWAPSSQGGY